MNREKMLLMTEHNLKKAEKALSFNITRKGVTEEEITNLVDKVEYSKAIYEMLTKED